MQLSSHSCFFLYFVRFHFAFLLRARTFRILSFNFYQTEYHASLTRNFIPFVTKKKKNTASIIFEPRVSTSIYIHVNIFLRFTIQSWQIFHNICTHANALLKIRGARIGTRGIFRNLAEIVSKVH